SVEMPKNELGTGVVLSFGPIVRVACGKPGAGRAYRRGLALAIRLGVEPAPEPGGRAGGEGPSMLSPMSARASGTSTTARATSATAIAQSRATRRRRSRRTAAPRPVKPDIGGSLPCTELRPAYAWESCIGPPS